MPRGTTAARLEDGERADVRAGADLRVVAHGVLDDGAGADHAVDEAGVRADLAAVADDGAALQHRAREQGDVAAELDRGVDVGLIAGRAW